MPVIINWLFVRSLQQVALIYYVNPLSVPALCKMIRMKLEKFILLLENNKNGVSSSIYPSYRPIYYFYGHYEYLIKSVECQVLGLVNWVVW